MNATGASPDSHKENLLKIVKAPITMGKAPGSGRGIVPVTTIMSPFRNASWVNLILTLQGIHSRKQVAGVKGGFSAAAAL